MRRPTSFASSTADALWPPSITASGAPVATAVPAAVGVGKGGKIHGACLVPVRDTALSAAQRLGLQQGEEEGASQWVASAPLPRQPAP